VRNEGGLEGADTGRNERHRDANPRARDHPGSEITFCQYLFISAVACHCSSSIISRSLVMSMITGVRANCPCDLIVPSEVSVKQGVVCVPLFGVWRDNFPICQPGEPAGRLCGVFQI